MILPPKIELALGYLGGTEANRIREYIGELQDKLAQATITLNEYRALYASQAKEVGRLQGFLIEDWKP